MVVQRDHSSMPAATIVLSDSSIRIISPVCRFFFVAVIKQSFVGLQGDTGEVVHGEQGLVLIAMEGGDAEFVTYFAHEAAEFAGCMAQDVMPR